MTKETIDSAMFGSVDGLQQSLRLVFFDPSRQGVHAA